VIFILVDTLRADRLGVYGNPRGLSPTMDALTREGVLFERCFAPAPWTLPAVASMITSYYPTVHGATSYRQVEDMDQGKAPRISVLSDKFVTLAEAMHERGYETAGFVANKFLKQEYGFGQGFDHYDASYSANTVLGEHLNAAATQWLAQRKDPSRPLFLYLHYMDTHGPYNAAAEFMDPLMQAVEQIPPGQRRVLTDNNMRTLLPYLRKPPEGPDGPRDEERFRDLGRYWEYWQARYEAGVREMDFYLARMIDSLKAAGLWDDAYVIFTADHGEALCEHGYWEHGYTMFQSDLHVPLALKWPGKLPGGVRVSHNVSLMDLFPTLAEQLGLPIEVAELQGQSLLELVAGQAPRAERVLLAESIKAGSPQLALIRGDWKLIRIDQQERVTADGRTLPRQFRDFLMNFAADPDEKASVHETHEELTEELLRLMAEKSAALREVGATAEMVEVDPATMGSLSAVGYVGGSGAEDNATSQPASAPVTQPAKDRDDDDSP